MSWKNNVHLSAITQALSTFSSATSNMHGWVLRATASEGRQSLMMSKRDNQINVYQDRTVAEESFQVELYVPSADGTQMGTAKGSLDPVANIENQLVTLHQNAQLALNTYFELPDKPDAPYADVQAADPDIVADIDGAHQKLIERVQHHCSTLTGAIVNSAELFINKHSKYMVSSKGIETEQETTDLYFEVAMEKAPGPNDQEVLKYWNFIGLKDADIETKLDSVVRETLLTEKATVPPMRDSAVILVESYAISKIIAALLAQANGSAEYAKGPHFKAGQSICSVEPDSESDRLTVSIDPTVPQMAKTTAFTPDGLAAQGGVIINEGIVATQIIDARMAQYLNTQANNIYGNSVVAIGTASKAELLAQFDEVIEILDFSSLLVNPSTLTWSSEIKLGLLHRKDKPATVLKGGIASGDVKASLASFKFSNETVKRNTSGGYFEAANGYVGPEHMLIWQGISIAGLEEA